MAYCKNCGQQIADQSVVCPFCGVAQNIGPTVVDKGGFWWSALGCCLPIVGLILFLVWKDTKPKSAKAAGIGALVSVGLVVLFYVIIIAFTAIAASMGL